jgi:hypothetical protein
MILAGIVTVGGALGTLSAAAPARLLVFNHIQRVFSAGG